MRFITTVAQVPIKGVDIVTANLIGRCFSGLPSLNSFHGSSAGDVKAAILMQPRETICGHFRGTKNELEIVLNFHKNGSLC